jgi:hypothetical protein
LFGVRTVPIRANPWPNDFLLRLSIIKTNAGPLVDRRLSWSQLPELYSPGAGSAGAPAITSA